MSQENSSQKHHYIPKFYLSNWAVNDSRLYYFYWIDNKFVYSLVSPRSTAFEYDLYSLEGASPERKHIIEEFLRDNIDTPSSRVLLKMLSDGISSLSDTERQTWANFLIGLRYRNPKAVRYWKEQGIERVNHVISDAQGEYSKRRGPDDPLTFEEFVVKKNPGLMGNFGVATLVSWMTEIDNRSTQAILEMNWWVVSLNGEYLSLLTNDNPCYFSSGLGDPNCLIALPIAPKVVFFATRDKRIFTNIKALPEEKIIRRVNETTVSQAFKYVYSMDLRQTRMVQNRLSKQGRGN